MLKIVTMKKIVFFLIVLVSSCSIQINGYSDDFNKVSVENKAKIVELKSFEALSPDYIYKISGKQLRAELSKHDKSIVYVFKNGCTSDYCKPMMHYETYAKKNGYQLFLVMNGYAHLDDTLGQRNSFESPLFVINTDYYQNHIRATYTKLFLQDVLAIQSGKEIPENGNIYIFEGDMLIKETRELPQY